MESTTEDFGDTAGDADEVGLRAREGVEHLQAAARELIAAARAALDVADELVGDPETAVALLGMLGGLGDIARRARAARPAGRAETAGRDDLGDTGEADDTGDTAHAGGRAGADGRVERIRIV